MVISKIKYIGVLLISILLLACSDEISIDVPEGEERLVIEAQLTNTLKDNLSFVRVTKSLPVNSTDDIPFVPNAIVTITNVNTSIIDTLKHSQNGFYINPTLKGEIGGTYKLRVETDGKVIESREETMLYQSEIDTAYGLRPRDFPDPSLVPPTENDFYIIVDYINPSIDINYNRWQLKSLRRSSTIDDPKGEFDDIFTLRYSVEDDERTSEGSVGFRPLVWDSFFGNDSIKIERYTLTRNAYEFWSAFQEQQSNSGTPFDTPPAPLPSNLFNIDDDKEQIVGIFSVSYVNQATIYLPCEEGDNCDFAPEK